MINKFTMSVFVLLPFICLAACSNNVQVDLDSYVNSDELQQLSQKELAIMSEFEKLTIGEIEPDDAADFLAEHVIYPYSEFVSDLETIRPATSEVSDLHNLYIEAASTRLEGYHLSEEFIASLGSDPMTIANDTLMEASSLMHHYREELALLAEEHDVVVK